MPKDTFFNLPEDKKERILNAAIDEFEEYGYQKASINRIVQRASIAKGSFYQYFGDKQDLFKFIMKEAVEKKLHYLRDVLAIVSELSFFKLLREMYISGIKFAIDHPKLNKIANDFIKNSDNKLKEAIFEENLPKSNDFLETLLKQGIEKEEIDPNIDVQLVAFMLTSLTSSIGEYFLKEVNAEDDMEVMSFIDKMLYVFENGIKSK